MARETWPAILVITSSPAPDLAWGPWGSVGSAPHTVGSIGPGRSPPRQLDGNAQSGNLTAAPDFCCEIPPRILRGCRSVPGQKSRFLVTSAGTMLSGEGTPVAQVNG